MAAQDTNTRVIIDVSLNAQDATKRANELGTSITAVKNAQKELKAENKENTAEYVENAQAIRQLTAEQKAYVTMSNQATGSNNNLRAQLAILSQQYNALGAEERDGTVAGKALQIQIKGLSDTLKTNESAVGDNRRNVGNYKEAIISANEEIGNQRRELTSLGGIMDKAPIGFKLLGDQVGSVTNQISNFRQASTEAREAQVKFKEAQTIATEATKAAADATERATEIGFKFSQGKATAIEAEEALTVATNTNIVATEAQTVATEAQAVATTAATKATNVFKLALASTGIGAIIVLVAGLISYLSKFDPIVDRVENAIAGLTAGFQEGFRIVVNFVRGITSLGDLLGKLGSIIRNPIASFKEMGRAMNAAANEAIRLAAAQRDLEDAQKIQEVTNAKALQQIGQLTLQSRNRSLSELQRQKLLKDAAKIDQDNYNQRAKLAKQEEQIALDQISLTANLNAAERAELAKTGLVYAFELKDRARVTDEQIDALKAAELARTQILTESTNRQEKLQNQSDALAEKAAAAAEKAAAAAEKAAEKAKAADQARLESLLATNERMLTARQQDVAAVNREIDEKIEKYRAYGATTAQLEMERVSRLQQITDDYTRANQAALVENLNAILQLQVDAIEDEGDRRLAQLLLNNDREIAAANTRILAIQNRVAKGEQDLTALLMSAEAERDELQKTQAIEKQRLLDEQYAAELDKFNQHQVDLAAATVATAGTDAEKLAANAALVQAKYQQEIDAAVLAGEDTTLINAEYEAGRKAQGEAVNAALLESYKKFSTNFQNLVGKNTLAYKIAADLQARVDAATALRNNILIIQENLKALASQGKLPFPYNLVAIASTLAALAGAAVSAKQIVAPVGYATGGVYDSGGKGGLLPGYSKTDNTNARLRSGEAVIVSEATRDPKALAALNAINVAYGGSPLAPGIAMATGGIATGGYISELSRDQFNPSDLTNMIVAAVQAAPPPVVSVVEIISAQQTVARNTVNLTL